MAGKKAKQLNWSASRRNEFIEFRVFWHGRINRADLMDTFGISLQQASLDLTRYSERWKRNLVYDKSQRAYVRGKAFKPRFITASAEDYLAQLRAVDQGLVTPVIRSAQHLSFEEVSVAMKELAEKARTKKLTPDEMQGGTMTISNLGSYGIDFFDAIISPPQSLILSIGAIVKKPVVNDRDEIVPGLRLNIGLSGDHRVVDGAVGAEYLAALRKYLEQPVLMLL